MGRPGFSHLKFACNIEKIAQNMFIDVVAMDPAGKKIQSLTEGDKMSLEN